MDVRLIAHTAFARGAVSDLYEAHADDLEFDSERDADELAEFAGRTCYLSYDRPNEKTNTNDKYLANIVSQEHFSVLEHASASFYVAGVSRNLLIELERHRFLSFSVVSTRYVDAHKLKRVIPPALGGGVADLDEGTDLWDYDYVVRVLQREGKTPKQAREAAAFFLPSGLETRFVVTGNLRAWRDVLGKRLTPAANAEIELFSRKVLTQLKRYVAPNSFLDFMDVDDV